VTSRGRGLPDRPLRILHCPDNVGAHPSTLARAERSIGLDSLAVSLSPSPFGYPTDRHYASETDAIWRRELSRVPMLRDALRWADVVHFNFGSTIAPSDTASPSALANGLARKAAQIAYRRTRQMISGRDMGLLALAKKGMIVTFQGDDVRPSASRRAVVPVDRDRDLRKAKLVRQFDRRASSLFALNPDLLEWLPSRAEFLPYANVDVSSFPFQPPFASSANDSLHIVHAPTDRHTKGTDAVVATVERLRSLGHSITLDLIEKAPHVEAMERLLVADIVIDQLRIGWYGGFAVEAMAMGKPVLAYLDQSDLRSAPVPYARAIPIVNVNDSTLFAALDSLITKGRANLFSLGVASRSFAESWHDPLKVAETLRPHYERAFSQCPVKR
jgi:hypothetical protein